MQLDYQSAPAKPRTRWWLVLALFAGLGVVLSILMMLLGGEVHTKRIATSNPALGIAGTVIISPPTPAAPVAAAPAPTIVFKDIPAPLFDDPVFHGASDPTLIWDPAQKLWFLYYTQRRATLENPHGTDWVHGCAIGIATSPDAVHWTYKDICHGDAGLDTPVQSNCTWWAPSVYQTPDGTFHMFVVYVDGIYTDWKGKAFIKHFTGTDGINWKYQDTLPLSSERCIDACVDKVDGKYRCWYKDERHGSHTWMASSDDLRTWKVDGMMIGDVGHEAPLYFHWKDKNWLITDAGKDLRIYQSPDGLSAWTFNAIVLKDPGKRDEDNSNGKHPFVLVQDGHAFIYYFVHYIAKDQTHGTRRSVLQMAELKLDDAGKVICDRDQ